MASRADGQGRRRRLCAPMRHGSQPTGHHLDAALVVPLSTLRARRPRPLHDGLPELTSSLRWDEHTDLWVSGALAALQLGPDAFNLAGAGLSAARIVSEWGIGCFGE